MAIKWIGSPNFDSNRKPIDRIVCHWFGVGNQAGADAQFQKANGTSAHYSIEDNSIHQYVKEEKVAYHAGNYAMNQRSIGIEHSAEPGRDASESTYQNSGKLIAEICKRYAIPLDRSHIIKHSEVKATQCPGTIDLDKLIIIAKGVNMSDTQEIDNLKNRIKDLEKEVTERKETIRILEEEKKKMSEEKNIEVQAEKDKYTRDIQYLATRLGATDDITEMGKAIDKLVVAEDGLEKCLSDKRACGDKYASLNTEYAKTLEELSLASGIKVASSAGVKRALAAYLKLHPQEIVGDIKDFATIVKISGKIIYKK